MKQKQHFLYSLLMAVVMMALSPTRVWAELTSSFMVMSDMHVMSKTLFDDGTAFTAYVQTEPKLVENSQDVFDAAITKIKTAKPDFVLIPGDLTKDGEKVSHEYVAGKLKELVAKGINVYVIPGNHDIGNPNAKSYLGETVTKVTSLTAEEWKSADFYQSCGYASAVETSGLSYMVYPADGIALIALDSRKPDTETTHYSEGGLTEATLAWAETAAAKAKAEGRVIIGMMHHPIIEHFDGHKDIGPTYLANQAEDYPALADDGEVAGVQRRLVAAGIGTMFTGHFHLQSIQYEETSAGRLYDVMTGSLSAYPMAMRSGTIARSGNITVASITDVASSEVIAKALLRNKITTQGVFAVLATKMVARISDFKKSYSAFQAYFPKTPSTYEEIMVLLNNHMRESYEVLLNSLALGDEDKSDPNTKITACKNAYDAFLDQMFNGAMVENPKELFADYTAQNTAMVTSVFQNTKGTGPVVADNTNTSLKTFHFHNYTNGICVCGHQAEASVTIDGLTTSYTYLFDVMDSNDEVYLSGALSAAKGHTAVVKLNADCVTSGSLDNEFSINNIYSLGNSAAEEPDGNRITLNLNGHKLDAQLNVYNTALTVTDAAEGGGKMYSGEDACALKCGTGSDVIIKGGKFSKIRIESADVSTVLGKNCYFRSDEDNQALVISANPVWEDGATYYYIENVYVVGNAQSMVADENLEDNIYDQTSVDEAPVRQAPAQATQNEDEEPETSLYQTYIDAALGNLSCCTFTGHGITAADLKTPAMIEAIQTGLSRAGQTALLNADSDIEPYVEAKLTAMTIETVDDYESGYVNVTTRMTFDVQPYALVNLGSESVPVAIENGLLQKEITFRLPVDSHLDAQLMSVSLDGNKVADCEVRRSTEAETEYKYIQVTSSTLGVYSYEANTKFILEDAVAFSNIANLTQLTSAQYRRTFAKANVWEPLYAPMQFSYDDFNTSCDIASIYTFGIMADTDGDGIISADDETILIVDPLTEGSTVQSMPYVVRAKQAGTFTFPAVDNSVYAATDYSGACSTTRTRYTFHGIYSSKQVDARQTLVLEEGVVSEASLGDAIAPQRWYIEATDKTGGYNTNVEIEQARGAGIRVLAIGEDLNHETALRILRGETVDLWQGGQRFTLDGRRAVAAERGFLIVNGKKTMVKE